MSPSTIKGEDVTNIYLKTLEEVNKQSQQYVKVSEIYKLPIQKGGKKIQYQHPSPEHPLTANAIRIK